MDDREGALLVGSLLTLGFLAVIGVVKVAVGQGQVGQTPASRLSRNAA